MIFGLLFAKYSMSALYNSYISFGTVLGVHMQSKAEALPAIYPITSACAITGVTLGSIASWIFCITICKRQI
ncbi:MAG: hypothetical protein LUG95_02755 [Clostridiales bacterium]|nr:hypothetical protein [Clostridiales bacterium]